MKQQILTTLLIFISYCCFSQNKEGYAKDLKIYREIVEKSHTGMYLYTPKDEFDSIFEALEKNIQAGKIKSDREFFNLLANIHTKINCGHSSIRPSSGLFPDRAENQATFFPLQVKFIKDTLVIAKTHNDLKKGTQILTINTTPVKEIYSKAFQIISSDGYNTTFKFRQLEEEFYYYYFLLYGKIAKFDLQIIPYPSADIKNITINGATTDGLKTSPKIEKPPTDLYYLDDKTAVLTVNTFHTKTSKNQKKFFKFLKKSFKEIEDKNIQTLILDIRENSGGNDGNDMELASYLISKPFKENKYRKLNNATLPLYPNYLHPQWRRMMNVDKEASADDIKKQFKNEIFGGFYIADDNYYYLKEKRVIRKNPSKYSFAGNTYVLISGKVFSGGALFSALVRDKSNAIFVGEETGGGYYRHTGSIPLIYELPNTKISFSIFIVINEQDVEQKLFPEGSGVIPHFEVYTTIKEFVDEQDAILNFVKKKSIR